MKGGGKMKDLKVVNDKVLKKSDKNKIDALFCDTCGEGGHAKATLWSKSF